VIAVLPAWHTIYQRLHRCRGAGPGDRGNRSRPGPRSV